MCWTFLHVPLAGGLSAVCFYTGESETLLDVRSRCNALMLISHHLFTATSIMEGDSIEREGFLVLLALHEPVSK